MEKVWEKLNTLAVTWFYLIRECERPLTNGNIRFFGKFLFKWYRQNDILFQSQHCQSRETNLVAIFLRSCNWLSTRQSSQIMLYILNFYSMKEQNIFYAFLPRRYHRLHQCCHGAVMPQLGTPQECTTW